MIKNKDKEKIKKIDICHPDIKIMYILVSIRISTWPEQNKTGFWDLCIFNKLENFIILKVCAPNMKELVWGVNQYYFINRLK